ncbi:MAG: type II toxin-antitoxin system HicA family toxin [Nitrospirae bacterium]|nr:type II toxin-antitoxin system HicA family toxin [Nitrospirota bacterium]
MSPKLPQISGQDLLKSLEKLGYQIVRQKGSHIRLRKVATTGEHNITVPNHKTLAKGTLNDILTRVSLWNNISKEELIKTL